MIIIGREHEELELLFGFLRFDSPVNDVVLLTAFLGEGPLLPTVRWCGPFLNDEVAILR